MPAEGIHELTCLPAGVIVLLASIKQTVSLKTKALALTKARLGLPYSKLCWMASVESVVAQDSNPDFLIKSQMQYPLCQPQTK